MRFSLAFSRTGCHSVLMDDSQNQLHLVPSREPDIEIGEEHLREFYEGVDRGLAQSARGEYVPGDEVFKWMESWGTENELPRPRIRRR